MAAFDRILSGMASAMLLPENANLYSVRTEEAMRTGLQNLKMQKKHLCQHNGAFCSRLQKKTGT